MTKNEFLRELLGTLQGRMPQADINEILLDYRDIFDSGSVEGKSEDEISAEIGSPAGIARTILSDAIRVDTSPMGDISNLASMGRRLGAYIIDSFTCGFLIFMVFILSAAAFFTVGSSQMEIRQDSSSPRYTQKITYGKDGEMSKLEILHNGKRIFKGDTDAYNEFIEENDIKISAYERVTANDIGGMKNIRVLTLLPLFFGVFVFGISNLLTTLQLWLTNGYTLGKWALKIRVVKPNGNKLTFLECFLRDTVIKTIANSITSGLLNLGSFIWASATPENKTVHDLAASTKVVNVVR